MGDNIPNKNSEQSKLHENSERKAYGEKQHTFGEWWKLIEKSWYLAVFYKIKIISKYRYHSLSYLTFWVLRGIIFTKIIYIFKCIGD